jgi:hypothetical protein
MQTRPSLFVRLFAVSLVCVSLLLVFAYPVSAQPLSERTQAILELDRLYQQALALDPTHQQVRNASAIPKSSSYHSGVAAQLSWHSISAYCSNHASISSWSCPSCRKFGSAFHPTAVVENQSNFGYVGWFRGGLPASPIPGVGSGNDAFVLISFRGSQNLANWIENLNFGKFEGFSAKYPQVKLHGGFWQAWNNVKGQHKEHTEQAGRRKTAQQQQEQKEGGNRPADREGRHAPGDVTE